MAESRVDEDWAQHFQDGVDAFWNYRGLMDNPNPSNTGAAFEWAAGWRNALEEDEAELEAAEAEGPTDWWLDDDEDEL